MMVYVTKSVDDFVPEGRWIASLSNGETIYEDEKKDEENCWIRLGHYCKENNLKITQMRWQYKHMCHNSIKDAEGYALIKKLRSFGSRVATLYYCGIGYVKDNSVHITFLCDNGDSSKEIREISTFKDPAQIIYNGQ